MQASRHLTASAVFELLSRVPEGKVTTYGDIARAAGFPRSSRAVGRILNSNQNPIIVPCHRVVMSDGTIGGYATGQSAKIKLLRKEGVVCAKGRIEGFDSVRAALF